MATGIDLRELAKARMYVAKILFEKGDYNGVVDNVGFAIELALKSLICEKLRLGGYPDSMPNQPTKSEKDIVNFFKNHDFTTLLLLSGSSSDFAIAPTNPSQLVQNWGRISTTWSPAVRYEPIGTYNRADAQGMLDAANDRQYGVMTYIKRRW